MPLSDDQKAMLRLLARDQSYDDIAALMGLSVDEVIARAKSAVTELEAEGIPAPTLPEAPGAKAPGPPAESKPTPAEPAKPPEPAKLAKQEPPAPAKPAKPKRPRDKGMLIAIGAGTLAAIVIVVLAVLLISGSDGDGDETTSASGDGTNVAASTGDGAPTTAKLVAVDGGDASGEATFGRVEESLGLGIKAQGLEPAPRGSIYMVWLAQNPNKMLPLTAVLANKNGRINASYAVPTEAVVYLASGEFEDLVITLSRNRDLRRSLERANKDKDFPAYTGEPVLEGKVVGPIIGAAQRIEEEKEK